MDMSEKSVLTIAQTLIDSEPDKSKITQELINSKIDMVLAMYRVGKPDFGYTINRDIIVDELIRRFSLWIGKDSVLQSDIGHMPWYTSVKKKEWRYWIRYSEWLEKSWSLTAVDALDRSTDKILGLLENPLREGVWDRRGLVVGHIQSGKTGNYTGLICKAADAGYKIIIILAGLHNNLRSQTQMRLDEGFLGYETRPTPDDIRIIGVGEIDADPTIRPNFATNRSEKGDFNTRISRQLGITPEQRPWLFVVKKNKTVLERLYRWIRNHVADSVEPDTKNRIVTNLPLMIIDDEADHASVDTGEQFFDADGQPDPDFEPRAINRMIRRLLRSFTRKAYVGYTATPFANIFIHERGETKEEGPDLFPSDFIISLSAPSTYIGPIRVFGIRDGNTREGGLPLIRKLTDTASTDQKTGWMPNGHKNGHIPLYEGQSILPPSLVEAIDAFVLSCAARVLRGQADQHMSMLVHVTRFNLVQQTVTTMIETHLRQMRQRLTRQIDHLPIIHRLEQLWQSDFLSTNISVRDLWSDHGVPCLPAWDEVKLLILDILSEIDIRMINGKVKDILDYVDHRESGLRVIAVGGDKLARGLTLEGLSVSYFLRASRMYDTLMQMGRWFGYRPGYLDLCRLYTTQELVEWYGHIADASEELRVELDMMAESGATPREYGLKVQSHPVLMVTSRLKMRTARTLMLSFSGTMMETVVLHRDIVTLQQNFETTKRLLETMGIPDESNPVVCIRNGAEHKWNGSHLWNNVPAQDITDFLYSYKTHPGAYKVDAALMAEFITTMTGSGELTSWTVALLGGGEGREIPVTGDSTVKMMKRTPNGDYTDRYSIGRLLSPRDEGIDLDAAAWQAALEETRRMWRSDPARMQTIQEPDEPNGPAIRHVRGFGSHDVPAHPERGLMLLYILDPAKAGLPVETPPVVAIGVSFPCSNTGHKVEYKVNNITWEQEYGPVG